MIKVPFITSEKYYHIRMIYKSGGETSYLYEVNKQKDLMEDVVLKIEKLVPVITFDGRRVYPKRIFECKIFATESPFEISSLSLHNDYPEGYNGYFGGEDVTLEITSQFLRESINTRVRELRERTLLSLRMRSLFYATITSCIAALYFVFTAFRLGEISFEAYILVIIFLVIILIISPKFFRAREYPGGGPD